MPRSKTRFLIEVTYLTGDHKGETWLMRKGGYVSPDNGYEYESTTYKTWAIAERRCRELESDNEVNYRIETNDREIRARQGKPVSSLRLYEKESYRPVPVKID